MILQRFEHYDGLAAPPGAGFAPLDAVQWRAQRPDAHWVAIEAGAAVARCSLWWTRVPAMEEGKPGFIGHFHAAPGASVRELLDSASRDLAAHGATLAVGPIDGDTWHSYRLVTDFGSEPAAFLEPWTPAEWPGAFIDAGFRPLATYHSGIANDLARIDPKVAGASRRLAAGGVIIRNIDLECFDRELAILHELSLQCFSHNFLYSSIDLRSFVDLYSPLRQFIDPRLVFIAEHGPSAAGFLFAIPDWLEAKRTGSAHTVIIKTVAARSGRAFGGLGACLVSRCHAVAKELGYSRAVHALMHDANNSANISRKYGDVLRRYTLFARRIAP